MQTRIVLHGKNVDGILKGLNKNFVGNEAKVSSVEDGAECVFEDSESARNAVNKTVREYIVKFLEPQEIKKIINRGYSFFNPADRKNLEKTVQSAIDNEEDIHDQLFVMRRNRIIENISESYFKENNELNLEGFLPFRLKSYCSELEELVGYNADAFMMRREYEEFIRLLKTYLLVQPHLLKSLDVVVTENRQYMFFDKTGRNITRQLENETTEEFGREADGDDLLVNVLINKNPGKIVLHNRRFMKREVADTIQSVFEERCTLCEGCSLCKK